MTTGFRTINHGKRKNTNRKFLRAFLNMLRSGESVELEFEEDIKRGVLTMGEYSTPLVKTPHKIKGCFFLESGIDHRYRRGVYHVPVKGIREPSERGFRCEVVPMDQSPGDWAYGPERQEAYLRRLRFGRRD
jgi:hypothetical protein